MFGCLCPGRPVQTNLQQIDESHAVFTLDNPATLNHICVFLLGTVLFPDGYAATVHLNWPGKGFQLLGMLSNERPSAIFRLRGNFIPVDASLESHAAFSTANQAMNVGPTALIGIAIEPIDAVLAQCAMLNNTSEKSTALSKPIEPTLVAERVAKNVFNYLSSFATGSGPDSTVTLGTVTRWYDYFVSKVRMSGISFLENEE